MPGQGLAFGRPAIAERSKALGRGDRVALGVRQTPDRRYVPVSPRERHQRPNEERPLSDGRGRIDLREVQHPLPGVGVEEHRGARVAQRLADVVRVKDEGLLVDPVGE